MMKLRSGILRALVLLLTVGAVSVWAQTFTGTFLGTVSDPSGAAIVGAKVTITNLATNISKEYTTDSNGSYRATLLPVGDYSITIEHAGFRRSVNPQVNLQVNQELRLDLSLTLGELAQVVVVSEAPPLVQTESATVGTLVDSRDVHELPLNGRNFLQLNLLVPGALPGSNGSQLGTQGGSINVHGLRESSNFFWLDGIDNTTLAIGQLVVNPPTYSTQEFRVQSPTYSAEFGRTAGAQINLITRSGSNKFHGDVYEFLRNSKLDAKNFFDPAGPTPEFRRNQFGVDVGGPIIHNKTFFFAAYEGIRQAQAGTFTSIVPLPPMITGDFSSLLLKNPPQHIINPFTKSDFPGNIINIPLDPIGSALAQAYPGPSIPGTQTLISNPISTLHDDSVFWKIDHELTRKDHLFARYNYENINAIDPVNLFAPTTNIPGFGRKQGATRFQTFGVSDTHTFSTNLLGEFRFGWNRWKLDYAQQDQGNPIAQTLGIQGLSTNPVDLGFPLLQMSGVYDNLGSATNLPQEGPFDTYQWSGTMAYTRGRHAFRFGGDFHYFASTFFLDFASRGEFFFTGGFTGDPLADLLLGLPSVALGGVGSTDFLFVSKSISGFAQDEWKIRSNVTLTLGLRYEYNLPVFEKKNRLTNFWFDTGQVVQAGQSGIPRATYFSSKRDVAPRIGLAWDLFGDGKWSIRTGYGIFYEIPVINTLLGLRLNPPFFSFNLAFADPTTPGSMPLGNAFGSLAGGGPPNINFFQKNFKDGAVQQWSFDVQHQITKNMVIDVGYVGTKGSNLFRTLDGNQPLPNPGPGFLPRPFPLFGQMTGVADNANSIYNGLEVRAEKRFSQGLTFLGSYTWSKAIDDSSAEFGNNSDSNTPQDSHNLRAERGLSDFDVRNRFVFSGIYELPFGPNRTYLHDASGFTGKLVEGWQIQTITQFQSGQPFTPVLAFDNSHTGELQDRPNLVGNPYAPSAGCPQTRTPSCWVNPAAFAVPPAGVFGNAGRDIVIGPGTKNVDFSLIKNTGITEELKLQFRAEFFNIANHPNFNNPNRVISPAFGHIFTAGPSRQIQFALRLMF